MAAPAPASALPCHLPWQAQMRGGSARQWREPLPSGLYVGRKGGTHVGRPEVVEMCRDLLRLFLAGLGGEEPGDLVGHAHKARDIGL